jgi:hypothetical protein
VLKKQAERLNAIVASLTDIVEGDQKFSPPRKKIEKKKNEKKKIEKKNVLAFKKVPVSEPQQAKPVAVKKVVGGSELAAPDFNDERFEEV